MQGDLAIRILYATSRFPYPPLKGDQVRSYHQLLELGKRHEVTLVTLCDPGELESDAGSLDRACAKIVRIPHRASPGAMVRGTVRSLLQGWPLQVGLYHSARLQRCIRDYLDVGQFDLLHLQLARLHSVAPVDRRIPVVMDMIDTLSLNMRRRAQQEGWPARWLFHFEASRLARLEREALLRCRRVVVVSEADRKALGTEGAVDVIPNGVDAERFRFQLLEGRKPETIVFSGNMSYFPNVDAATWFIEAVLPLVLNRRPHVEFMVAGSNPHPSLRRLAESNPAVVLTGFVPRMEEVLASTTLAVAPMRSGTGIQNKVIEAMASGLPVVASPFALGGLSCRGGEIEVAEGAEEFADKVIALLDDPSRRSSMAVAARAYVEASHSWQSSAASLEESYEHALEGGDALARMEKPGGRNHAGG